MCEQNFARKKKIKWYKYSAKSEEFQDSIDAWETFFRDIQKISKEEVTENNAEQANMRPAITQVASYTIR